jgi:transposase-like protein
MLPQSVAAEVAECSAAQANPRDGAGHRRAVRKSHTPEPTLREGVRQANGDGGRAAVPALTAAERKELEQRRRDRMGLEAERDFLKRAAALLARDETRSVGRSCLSRPTTGFRW